MKKIFTLIAMVVLAVAAQAQVVFLDPEDKEYADGQTMTINGSIDPDWGGLVFEAPKLKNAGSADVNVYINVDIKTLPEFTAVQECFADNCYIFDAVGSHDTKAVAFAAGETKSTATEWLCLNGKTFEYEYGTCTVVLTAYVDGAKDKTVTVNYVNAVPSGISTVDKKAEVVERYDLQGRIAAKQKGIIIERMSDGTVRRVVK